MRPHPKAPVWDEPYKNPKARVRAAGRHEIRAELARDPVAEAFEDFMDEEMTNAFNCTDDYPCPACLSREEGLRDDPEFS